VRPRVACSICCRYFQHSCGRRPNAGHEALAQLAPHYHRFTVLTQNVDGLHGAAGQPDLIEIHGNLQQLHCAACPYETRVADYARLAIPPHCPRCSGPVRPRVVLFGEALPEAALARLEHVLDEGSDLVLSVGTSSSFPYVAAPVLAAARSGLPTAEINPGDSEISGCVRHRIRERAGPALRAVADAVLARLARRGARDGRT
jgi:NAD-dependent deacetylase